MALKNSPCTLEALKNRFLLRPSAQYTIPSESIPDNGLVSVRFSEHLCSFYRHLIVQPKAYVTQISVVSFASEKNVFTLTYQWNLIEACGRKFPPRWVHSPRVQVCDLALSTSMLAFGTIENTLIYTLFNDMSHPPTEISAIDLFPIIKTHYKIVKSERICLTVKKWFIAMVIQGKTKNNSKKSIIILVDTRSKSKSNHKLYHFALETSLDVSLFSTNNILTSTSKGSLVLLIQYRDSNHMTQIRAIHLNILDMTTDTPVVHAIPSHSKNHFSLISQKPTIEPWKIELTCQCPISFSDGYLAALNNLARSFSMPFFSLVASDTSKISSLSSRLNSPWAMPVALMHLLLFTMLLPFLLVPEHSSLICIKELRSGEIKCERRHQFLSRRWLLIEGPFVNFDEFEFEAGNNYYALVKETPKSLVIQKFSPTALSKSAYSQSNTFRSLSIIAYFLCLLTFGGSIFLLFKTVPSAKIDLVVEFSIMDALSVYLLSICQDLVLIYSLIRYKLKTLNRNRPRYETVRRSKEDYDGSASFSTSSVV